MMEPSEKRANFHLSANRSTAHPKGAILDRNQAREELKKLIESELQSRGIDTRKPFKCLNPQHDDRNPSMSLDKANNRAKCFSCDANYDIFDILGLDDGYTDDETGLHTGMFRRVLEKGCAKYGIDLDDKSSSTSEKSTNETHIETDPKKLERILQQIKSAQENTDAPEFEEYLKSRGISVETAKAHGLGYLPHFFAGNNQDWQALIIPTGTLSYTARNLHSKGDRDRYQNRGTSELFNFEAIYSPGMVHIVEGEIDALSVIEAGGQAIALGSTANAKKFIERFQEVIKSPSKPPLCEMLILSLDNDEPGQKAASTLFEGLFKLREETHTEYKIKKIDISKGYKDPNAYLLADPEGFKVAVTQTVPDEAKAAYLATSAAAKLPAFCDGVAASANTPAIPTGFKLLDRELDGGLYEGFYIVAAITSLGKTTFILQMADNIAAAGQDVLYVSLEMAESELIARSLSRHTFTLAVENDINRTYAKSVRGITDGKRYTNYLDAEQNLIMDAYGAYDKYASRLYFYEGLGDITPDSIRKRIQTHIDMTGRTPVVFVDYVQILAPTDPRATDKQNIDKAALELKRISRDFKTPVIVISSLNRDNYRGEINLAALKESGALEYSSDVVLGMQFQGAGSKEAKAKGWVDEQKNKDPRAIQIKVLKNRNGRSGGSLYFDYYPVFNLMVETDFPRNTAPDDDED